VSFRVLLGLGCLFFGLVSCAKGGQFAGTGGSSSGGSSSGGGGEGGGDTTSTTTAGGTGGGATTTTTPTEMCSESPCKLVTPQCGCAAGEMCALTSAGDRECRPGGDKAIGEECTDLFSCEAGALCAGVPLSTLLVCARYCDTDADCAGALCLIELNNAQGDPIPDVKICTDNCDPVGSSGCPVGLDLSCQLYQFSDGGMEVFTLCSGAGAGTQGASCADNDDCAPGYACFTVGSPPNDTNQCLQWCKPPNGACPAGATGCQSFPTPLMYNGVEYGACL
jgi:hypothetical protein